MKTVVRVILTATAMLAWVGFAFMYLPYEVTFIGVLAVVGIALIAVAILAFMKWVFEL